MGDQGTDAAVGRDGLRLMLVTTAVGRSGSGLGARALVCSIKLHKHLLEPQLQTSPGHKQRSRSKSHRQTRHQQDHERMPRAADEALYAAMAVHPGVYWERAPAAAPRPARAAATVPTATRSRSKARGCKGAY